MSVAILLVPTKQHTLQDDLESFFHVMLYIIVRYFNHGKTKSWVSTFIHNYFNSMDHLDTGVTVGFCKQQVMFNGTITQDQHSFQICNVDQHPLAQITAELLDWFKAYYHLRIYEKDIPQPAPRTQPDVQSADKVVFKEHDIPSAWAREMESMDASSPKTLPIPHLQSLAAKMVSHVAIGALFVKHMRAGPWGAKETVEDQLLPSFMLEVP